MWKDLCNVNIKSLLSPFNLRPSHFKMSPRYPGIRENVFLREFKREVSLERYFEFFL